MKQCAGVLVFLLMFSILCVAADSDRKHIVLDQSASRSAFPFSDAVLVGNTLFIGGTVGFEHATGKPPASAEEEAKLAMEGVKQVLASQGMEMDDLVSVQVVCTDLASMTSSTASIGPTSMSSSRRAHFSESPA
jgi:enamine deaminase RidA (YjgF/YER057c/UK114 family)